MIGTLLPFEEARSQVLAGAARLGVERVATAEAAGRYLAEDLVAREPMPAFTYSAVDGYALATAELGARGADGRLCLPIAGESRAGGALPARVAGTACRIFTGAELAPGTDAVLMQEDVERDGDTIAFAAPPGRGANVRQAGSDLATGELALAAGLRLHPGRLALCAALDRAHLVVARRPVVSVLSTGDELRAPGEPGDRRSIPDSNSFALGAIGRAAGAVTRVLPPLCDDRVTTARAIADGLAGCDLLITVGGVSVGDHDWVRPALADAGVELAFWGVAMKPGKPTAYGALGARRVLCVPGNPGAATLAFLLFGVPLLRALQGDPTPVPVPVTLPVRGSFRRKAGRMEFLRAALERSGGEDTAVLEPNQASGAVVSFARADALVLVTAETTALRDGERHPVLRLGEVWA